MKFRSVGQFLRWVALVSFVAHSVVWRASTSAFVILAPEADDSRLTISDTEPLLPAMTTVSAIARLPVRSRSSSRRVASSKKPVNQYRTLRFGKRGYDEEETNEGFETIEVLLPVMPIFGKSNSGETREPLRLA